MKTLLIACLGLAVLAAAPATATGQSGGTDSVGGEASDCLRIFEFVPGFPVCVRMESLGIEVESGPAGENATGTISWLDMGTTPSSSFFAPVEATCLSVSGSVAIIGVTGMRQATGREGTPIAGLIRVVDGGGPDSGADSFEFAFQIGQEFGPPLPGPTSCSSFPASFPRNLNFFPDFTNELGDVVVVDTRPMPTSMDQCKGGGWRTYGVFKNQGDCVSFVATGGKKPPGN